MHRHLRIVDTKRMDTDISLKVAFASSNGLQVDQHFGSAVGFVFYAVNPASAQLLEVAQFEASAQDGNEDKLSAKLSLLEGCAAVYCQAVGASAIRQLTAKGIQPVKVSESCEIDSLIQALQEELHQGPSSWVAKALKRSQSSTDLQRFEHMEQEGWQE
jgi:nitrogen fixation protein NifX